MRKFNLHTMIVALSMLCISCTKPDLPGTGNGGQDSGDSKKEAQEILNRTRATKVINPFDETKNRLYKNSGLQYDLSSDRRQGKASFEFRYSFKGDQSSGRETAWFEQTSGDFRSDLSLEPLGLSLWVKGTEGNKGVFRFVLMEDEMMYSSKPYDHTRARWQYYAYEDREILSKEGWHKLVMPYSAFKVLKKGNGVTSTSPVLNRFAGYRIEVVNEKNEVCSGGKFCVDELKQLTSFEVKANDARFTSMFIQLHCPSYDGTNWAQQFRDSKAIGIDTWIIQAAGQFGDKTSFYRNSSMNWTKKVDYIDRMFEAAEKEGMKLIIGLYPGQFTRYNYATPACYEQLFKQHKQCFDELYALYGKHPCLAGWYIPEEFHDGYGMWQQASGLKGLAEYYERVASYVKTKSDKPVCIAPALWRGMPADIVGKWFEDFFFIASSIDFLYVQDCGGRMFGNFFLTDPDVDLPNWYGEIRKACEKTGVEFGVDLESFREDTYGPNDWKDVLVQLQVAGMYTKHITNFSWNTFKKGTPGYNGYKSYIQNK